jgi:enterochelin esterase family protein
MRGVLVVMGCVVGMGVAQAQGVTKAGFPVRSPHEVGYVAAKTLPDGANAPVGEDGNFILGPTHVAAPEMVGTELQGRVVEFTMSSAESKMYPGIAREVGTSVGVDPSDPLKPMVESHAAAYTRKVAVYVPKEYVAGAVVPFIVGADGPDLGLFKALDGLIGEGKLPVMVAVSIGNGGWDAQGSERGLEYDTMSGRYAEFVETEVLPRVEAEAHVRLTHDPEARATMGGSSGGSCALAMAWYHPEWYRRVLTYSGTYVNQQWPWDAKTPGGAWEFARTLIPGSARKPIRIWMEVGDRDLYNPNAMRDRMHDWVLANELMAKALAAKGYKYQFVFAENAGHVDGAVKRQTLPEALEWVWSGYQGK